MSVALILAACSGVLAWFVARARAGARARAAAGVRLRLPNRLAEGATAATGRTVLVGGLAAAATFGWAWAPLGAAGAYAWRIAARRQDAAREEARIDAQVPDGMRAVAAGMRAGASLPLAIAAAGEEIPPPLGPHLARCAGRCSVGMPLDEALGRLATDALTPATERLVATLRVGSSAPASLPGILDAAALSQEAWLTISRDRAAATSQARMSAAVVAGMPLAFLLLAGPAARGPARLLLGEPAGWVLLGAGLLLDAAGWLWMRRIASAT